MNQNMRLPVRRKFPFTPGISAVIFGSVVVIFLFATDQLSKHYGLSEPQKILDDFCGGIIAGLLIYRYQYSRSKYLNEKLKTIELMNHHVRNALQTIVSSAYAHGHDQLDEIRTPLNRIEWALREVLPGRVLDNYDEPGALKKNPIQRPSRGVVARPWRSGPNW
jgi:hypothetical protein